MTKYTMLSTNSTQGLTGEILTDKRVNGKDRPWRRYKVKNIALATIYEQLELKKHERVQTCGNYLTFTECKTDSNHPKRLKKAFFCRDRLCPTCSWRKSLATAHQVRMVCHTALLERKMRFILLTLTVKNCAGYDLSSTIDAMFAGFQRLTQLKRWKDSVLGYFRSLEVTYDVKKETYHPHFHVLLAVPSGYFDTKQNLYIKQTEWIALWRQVMRLDYTPVVDVRIVKPNKKRKDSDALTSAVAEVVKYSVKPEIYDLPPESLQSAIKTLDSVLKSRRLVSYGGLLKNVSRALKIADVEVEDLVHTGDDVLSSCNCAVCGSDLVDHMYKWQESNYVGFDPQSIKN